jgi:hypothetical protein
MQDLGALHRGSDGLVYGVYREFGYITCPDKCIEQVSSRLNRQNNPKHDEEDTDKILCLEAFA